MNGNPMRLVVIESPFAGKGGTALARKLDENRNLRYLRACMHDCLVNHGEAPYASHGLYTQDGVLDDTIPEEREHGIQAGFAWRQVAHATVVYIDFGISRGMEYGIDDAKKRGVPITYRNLPNEAMRKVLES